MLSNGHVVLYWINWLHAYIGIKNYPIPVIEILAKSHISATLVLLGFRISQVLVKEFIFHHLKNISIENPFRGAGKDW